MSRRRIAPEDLELWQRVADETERLHRRDTAAPVKSPAPPAQRRQSSFAPAVKLDGKTPPAPPARRTSADLAPNLRDALRQAPVAMDRKTFTRMTRGKVRPEARIDLHGMTMDRAHGALSQFIMRAHGSGKRLVLVITGKGKNRDEGGPIPVRHGVLRHQVPQWLRTAPMSGVVLQIAPAHASHGGDGAYYVYLKRSR